MKIFVSVLGANKTAFETKTEMEIPPASNLRVFVAESLRDAAEELSVLSDSDGNLRRHLVIQVNRKRVLPSKAAEFVLTDGDDIVIYLPISGG